MEKKRQLNMDSRKDLEKIIDLIKDDPFDRIKGKYKKDTNYMVYYSYDMYEDVIVVSVANIKSQFFTKEFINVDHPFSLKEIEGAIEKCIKRV